MRSKPKRWFHSACFEILVCVFSFLPVGYVHDISYRVIGVGFYSMPNMFSQSLHYPCAIVLCVTHILRVSQSCNRRGVIWSYDVKATDNVTSYTFQRLVRNDAFGIIKTNAHLYINKINIWNRKTWRCVWIEKKTSKDFETISFIKNSL